MLDIKAKLVVQAEPSMERERFLSKGTFLEASHSLQGGLEQVPQGDVHPTCLSPPASPMPGNLSFKRRISHTVI